MITAVDTNVLIDLFGADPTHGPASREAVRRCLSEGSMVACEVVWAEVLVGFDSAQAAREALDDLGVRFSEIGRDAAAEAGEAFAAYRKRGGRRERVAADFLVGAHALVHADRLLTRDRGFYGTSFEELEVLDPAAPPR